MCIRDRSSDAPFVADVTAGVLGESVQDIGRILDYALEA